MRDLDAIPGCIERGADGGAWRIEYKGRKFLVVASYGMGWEHVSVSLVSRPPKWAELEHIKRMFFEDDEWAMQLHAPPSKHISIHPNTLHLWRPVAADIPIPPEWMV